MNDQEEHLDPTSEISLETVKERSVRGVVTLTGRYFILYGFSFVAQLFLAAFLTREEFGIFGIVSAFVNFLIYFSDIGLAASLIQKKEALEEEDLKTTFTIQQILVWGLLGILYFISPLIRNSYHFSQSAMYLLYALAFSFLLSSLKTIPSVILERSLKFERIAIANIFENLVYNIFLVFLAWKGFGITSFTIAVVARGVIGLVSIYTLQPWRPGFSISLPSLRGLLKFGLPYQINSFIALAKDDGLTVVLGKILGLDSMGILIWAQKWAQMPLRVVMDTVTKVTFPAFSRMQGEKEQLERSVTRSLFFICFLVFPAVSGLVILSPIIVRVIPRYEKWIPALLPLAFLSVNSIFAAFTTQLTNLLNAIGKIKTTTILMIMWAGLTWLLVPALSIKFGVNGASFGYGLVGASSLVALYFARKSVKFSVTDGILKPLYGAIFMSVILIILRRFLPVNSYSLWILTIVGVVVYGVSMLVIIGAPLMEDAKRGIKTFFPK